MNETMAGNNAPDGAPVSQNGRQGRRRRKPATDSIQWLKDRGTREPYRQQFVKLGGRKVRIA